MALSSRRLARNLRLERAAKDLPPLRKPETGEAVQIIQQAFIDLGFSMPLSTRSSDVDGIYGDETASTVKSFQARNSLVADGVAGQQTLGLLDLIFSRREAAALAALTAEVIAPSPLKKWDGS